MPVSLFLPWHECLRLLLPLCSLYFLGRWNCHYPLCFVLIVWLDHLAVCWCEDSWFCWCWFQVKSTLLYSIETLSSVESVVADICKVGVLYFDVRVHYMPLGWIHWCLYDPVVCQREDDWRQHAPLPFSCHYLKSLREIFILKSI